MVPLPHEVWLPCALLIKGRFVLLVFGVEDVAVRFKLGLASCFKFYRAISEKGDKLTFTLFLIELLRLSALVLALHVHVGHETQRLALMILQETRVSLHEVHHWFEVIQLLLGVVCCELTTRLEAVHSAHAVLFTLLGQQVASVLIAEFLSNCGFSVGC